MIPALRTRFNASWTESQYQLMLVYLQEQTRGTIEFSVSETPCFFPRPLIEHLADVGVDLIQQCLNGDAAAAAASGVPERFCGAEASEPTPRSSRLILAWCATPQARSNPGSSSCRRFRPSTDFKWRLPTRIARPSTCLTASGVTFGS